MRHDIDQLVDVLKKGVSQPSSKATTDDAMLAAVELLRILVTDLNRVAGAMEHLSGTDRFRQL